MRILIRIGYEILFYLWCSLPAGMGAPPWHRYSKIFKLENWK